MAQSKPNKRRPRGRPRTQLNRERILLAAAELADQNGIETLSMRKLAQSLNVEAMSLYNHVKNKEDMFDGMVEFVVSKIQCPSLQGNWKDEMRIRAQSAHHVLVQHPWATSLLVSRVNIGPNMLCYVDATIGCLRQAGFSYERVDRAWNAIDSHIYGFTLQSLNFPFEADEYSDVAEEYLPQIPETEYPFLNALSQQIIEGEHDGVQEFNFGLELLLDGLERMLEEQNL